MPQMSQVLRERAIGMLLQECPPELLPENIMLISLISTTNVVLENLHTCGLRTQNCRPRVWRRVGERFADVNIVNRVPHSRVLVWAGISYGQRTQLRFIDWQFKCIEIL
jgi:hypothetical protein